MSSDIYSIDKLVEMLYFIPKNTWYYRTLYVIFIPLKIPLYILSMFLVVIGLYVGLFYDLFKWIIKGD